MPPFRLDSKEASRSAGADYCNLFHYFSYMATFPRHSCTSTLKHLSTLSQIHLARFSVVGLKGRRLLRSPWSRRPWIRASMSQKSTTIPSLSSSALRHQTVISQLCPCTGSLLPESENATL